MFPHSNGFPANRITSSINSRIFTISDDCDDAIFEHGAGLGDFWGEKPASLILAFLEMGLRECLREGRKCDNGGWVGEEIVLRFGIVGRRKGGCDVLENARNTYIKFGGPN